MSDNTKYTEALNNYYTKKRLYSEQVKKILKKGSDVNTQIKCIKCKKKGGTTFERIVEKEDGKYAGR